MYCFVIFQSYMVGKHTSHYLMIDGQHCHFPKTLYPNRKEQR